MNSRSNLTVKWISSHSEVLGNEKADQLATNAAKGHSSALTTLPLLFRTPLPRSTSVTKQAHNLTLQKLWADQWNCYKFFPTHVEHAYFITVYFFSSLFQGHVFYDDFSYMLHPCAGMYIHFPCFYPALYMRLYSI